MTPTTCPDCATTPDEWGLCACDDVVNRCDICNAPDAEEEGVTECGHGRLPPPLAQNCDICNADVKRLLPVDGGQVWACLTCARSMAGARP